MIQISERTAQMALQLFRQANSPVAEEKVILGQMQMEIEKALQVAQIPEPVEITE